MGHQQRFGPPSLRDRCEFREGTFAGRAPAGAPSRKRPSLVGDVDVQPPGGGSSPQHIPTDESGPVFLDDLPDPPGNYAVAARTYVN
jgi:hypothetical protein